MQRLAMLILGMLALLALGTGATAHTLELSACETRAEAAAVAAHVDGDVPQSPDPDAGYGHQHVSCHGHHFAALSVDDPVCEFSLRTGTLRARVEPALRATLVDPALRPPIA